MKSSPRTPRAELAAYALVALLILGFGALAARYYSTVKTELTEAAMARRVALAHLAAALLAERLDRMVDIAVSLATRVRFAELVSAGDFAAAITILQRAPQEFPFVERLFLADVEGTLRADVPGLAGSRGRNFAGQDWYRGVSREWKPYVSTVYQRAEQPRINVIAVAVPVHDRQRDTVAGILVVQLSLQVLYDQLRVGLDGGASLSAVDRLGQAGYRSGVPVQAAIADLAAHAAVRELLQGRSGARIGLDEATGAQVLQAFDPAKYGWGVLIEEPAATAFAARERQLGFIVLAFLMVTLFLAGVAWLGVRTGRERQRAVAEEAFRLQMERQVAELTRAQEVLARQAERLRIVHEIDRAIIAEVGPEAIAAAVLQSLRALLGVPRAIVNMIDVESGEVEWLAAAGRHKLRVGPGVRYSSRLMGDLAGLRRGEPQRIAVHELPPGPEADALVASGVHFYMAVPMVAGGELIGALSFGGEQDFFPREQVAIAQEVATQLAIAIAHARLFERVRRQAEELEIRVRERTAQLEAANKELESFSYSVSHDLRAPLRAVDGYALMLEEDYGAMLDAEGQRLLGVVRSNSRQMGRLIDDLLAFSKLGRQAPAKRSLDMAGLVNEVIAGLEGAAHARIQTSSIPPAQADRALLRQVWINLLDNALKYSGKRPDARIEVGGRREPGESLYWVRDNGVGFDMRYAGKLFGVFQRLHGASEFPGTGVGLAIVQRVVSRHGGRVWAESRPDEGACFYFTLPEAA